MADAKAYFERFGHMVNCPADPNLQKKPLIMIQEEWIEKIKEADLIVVIPKNVSLVDNGESKMVFEFGESTSYEMAIAESLGKPKVIF